MARAAVRESVTVAGLAERARVVRAFVAGVLGPGHPCGDDAGLLVSELFGNSLRYSRSGDLGGTVTVVVAAGGGIKKYGTTQDGRIFQTSRGGLIQDSAYSAMWAEARKAALTEAQYRSPLGRRPYDLRHASVSPWLNSGVPATEVARRAGHGVAVLLKIYAHCIDGQADAANQRITDALGTKDTEPDPGGEEDDDSEKAS